jgi:hypothetical protein
MLRSKSGIARIYVEDLATGKREKIKLEDHMAPYQTRKMSSSPDMLWQFAQRLKKEYAEKGKEVAVFIDSKVWLNTRGPFRIIDPDVDLASVPWERFKHSDWILSQVYD